MVRNSHNSNHHRYSHCRSHWKRKSTSHHHRLSLHDNCIRHNRSFCPKWNLITNCIRTEPKVINKMDRIIVVPNSNQWATRVHPSSSTVVSIDKLFDKCYRELMKCNQSINNHTIPFYFNIISLFHMRIPASHASIIDSEFNITQSNTHETRALISNHSSLSILLSFALSFICNQPLNFQ